MFCTSVLWDVSESFEWNSVQVSGSFVSLLDEQGDERLSPSARLLKNAVDGFDLLFWMDANHYIIDLDAELSLYSMEVFCEHYYLYCTITMSEGTLFSILPHIKWD